MAAIFAVEFGHEGLVWVADYEDAGVEGFNLLFSALVGLYADGSSTAPVVALPFKTCRNTVLCV